MIDVPKYGRPKLGAGPKDPFIPLDRQCLWDLVRKRGREMHGDAWCDDDVGNTKLLTARAAQNRKVLTAMEVHAELHGTREWRTVGVGKAKMDVYDYVKKPPMPPGLVADIEAEFADDISAGQESEKRLEAVEQDLRQRLYAGEYQASYLADGVETDIPASYWATDAALDIIRQGMMPMVKRRELRDFLRHGDLKAPDKELPKRFVWEPVLVRAPTTKLEASPTAIMQEEASAPGRKPDRRWRDVDFEVMRRFACDQLHDPKTGVPYELATFAGNISEWMSQRWPEEKPLQPDTIEKRLRPIWQEMRKAGMFD